MGASISRTQAEANNNINNTESNEGTAKMTAEEYQLLQVQNMPKYVRPETFEEKLYRKFSTQPLVPIGCGVTAYFLASGINSFYNRDAVKSQKMMRLRVGAQFGTLLVLIGYAGLNAVNFNISPGYHGDDKRKEEQER